VPTTSFGATPARLANVLQGPQDPRLVFAPDSSGYDPKLARFVGDYDIAEVDGKLVVTSRVDGETWTLVEFIADSLATDLSQFFGFLPSARHTPRVSIDNLVLHRETWRFTAGELDFAATKDEKLRYAQCRAWVAGHDLPRYVFVRAQGEIKPVYADLTSLSSVDLVCRLARRVKMNHGDAGDVVVSEMLPTPDQLWLSDSQGRRYTSELRVCAVDRVGRP